MLSKISAQHRQCVCEWFMIKRYQGESGKLIASAIIFWPVFRIWFSGYNVIHVNLLTKGLC